MPTTLNMSMPLILASASPARKKLLQMVGINPIVRVSNFDESTINAVDTLHLVQTLAQCKAQTIAPEFDTGLILGCDSVLEVAGEVYGKPKDKSEAIERWQKMRGRVGTLYTGHALIDRVNHQTLTRCGITKVHFANISDETIIAYVDTEEPLKCAGCFTLEGKGGLFVERLEGCHSNVLGLSLPLFRQMLTDFGYQITEFF